MDESRRTFLKAAGITALGVGWATPIGAALARATQVTPRAEGLTATRWAMVIDSGRCMKAKGCNACIQACHTEHNVPQIPDPRLEVKWLWKDTFHHAFPTQIGEYSQEGLAERPALLMCNHCDNPACVRVCPTQATFKRGDGIVMMDMHRCVGCRYCITACPYGARSFNFMDPRQHIAQVTPSFPTRAKGVVEKCTFCAERLAAGIEPACVEACARTGNRALVFGDLADRNSEVAELVRSKFTLRRKPGLGTLPHVFYIV